jgi:hypothetical protein
MVTATVRITVVDGEVIPVENTPPKPPPLLEPPPFIVGFDHCIDYYDIDSNNGYKYSVTSIDGELILLFRLVY